jgi:protein-tyrosine phosphatase
MAASLSACISTTPLDAHVRPQHWASVVNKQTNLYQVSPQLYRSEQPLKADTAALQQLNIKTVVNLRARNKDAVELAESNMKLVHVPINTWSITSEQLAQALWQIEQAKPQGNVLLHCYHGSDRTGLVTAMYRIIYQNWPIADSQREMKYGGFGFHPVWVNIDQFFTAEKVTQIQQLISRYREQDKQQQLAEQTTSPPATTVAE